MPLYLKFTGFYFLFFILFYFFIFYLEAKDEKMTDEDPPFSLLFSQSL